MCFQVINTANYTRINWLKSIFTKKKIFPIFHESSGHGKFHEQKTEIKGIIGMRNYWTTDIVSCNNERRKAAKIWNRYNQVIHMTQDTKWESDKTQLNSQTRAKKSALSQQVITRQQWTDAKAWQTQDIDNTNDPQKKYRLRTVGKNILLKGLNQFHCVSFSCIIYPHHSF